MPFINFPPFIQTKKDFIFGCHGSDLGAECLLSSGALKTL